MAKLRPASYADVAPFRSAAARDHVSVSETRGTSWFLYEDGDELIGLCALMKLQAGARIKGVWVRPELRGKGHGRQMTLDLIKHAFDEMLLPRLEAYAHNPGFMKP
jgi:RimJ/RimL family protein N-acetyltransferase